MMIYSYNTYMSDKGWILSIHLVQFHHLYHVIVAIMVMLHSGAL